MTNREQLAALADRLNEDQVGDLVELVRYMAAPKSLYETLTETERQEIDLGISEIESGAVIDGADVHRDLRARIANAAA